MLKSRAIRTISVSIITIRSKDFSKKYLWRVKNSNLIRLIYRRMMTMKNLMKRFNLIISWLVSKTSKKINLNWKISKI